MRARTAVAIGVLGVILAGGGWGTVIAAVPSSVVAQAIPRTVILMLLAKSGDTLRVFSNCSGSFVSPVGHILTASHCVRAINDNATLGFRKGELYNPEGKTAVGINVPDQDRPVLQLFATYVADDPVADVAMLKVSALLNRGAGDPLPADLRVPYLVIGDSGAVRHGDPVALIGFPAAGEDTVSVNQGSVSGFIADEQNRRIRLKYDAVGGGGASGGPVINASGEQIAIHTGGHSAGGVYQLRGTLTGRLPAPWMQAIRGAVEGGALIPPDPRLPRTAGVVFEGRIIDAQTGAGVSGAAFYILKPGTPHRSASGADVLARGVSDGRGLFQTRPAVARGASYPVLVYASGYQPVEGTLSVVAQGPEVEVLKPIAIVRP